jgi:hypothetical protein
MIEDVFHCSSSIPFTKTCSGARKWVVNLHKYMIIYGLKFSKSDQVFFIHVLYGLLTSKHVDTVTLDAFAKVSLQWVLKFHNVSSRFHVNFG